MDAFAEFHAFWWDHPALGELDPLPSQASVAEDVANTRKHYGLFADVLGDRLTGSQRRVYERTLASFPSLWARVLQGKTLTLIHGDANFSNVLLPCDPNQDRALIIDWQLWGIGFATLDLSHMMALFWDKEHRQKMEKRLLMHYHQALIRHGVEGYAWTDCWEDYRLAVLLRILFMPMWFRVSGAPEVSWMRSLDRAMQAVKDLGCLDLVER
jgi:Ser/Thr protein kinase RdoA (MazF antagonist)